MGVRVPGVVELGQQQLTEGGIGREPDPLVVQLVAEPFHAAGAGVGVGHLHQPARHRNRSVHPVTNRAASEHSQVMISATSAGLAMWW